jgi:murein hydrolase activator
LKASYAKSLVFAYKNRSNYDYLNFLFSATDFNDAVKRMAYLKSYRQYRETQVGNIRKTQSLLEQKAAVLNSNKQEKNNNIQQQNQQLKVLEVDRKEKDQVVKQLKGQEQGLAKEIKDRERARQKLSASLQAIIRREIDEERKREASRLAEEKRKADAAAKANANNNASGVTSTPRVETKKPEVKRPDRVNSALESTPEGLTLSLNFEKNKGRLPWPVSQGSVVIPFGKYEIPGTRLKGVSDGIEIGVSQGTSVKSVADGEVRSVVDMGGGDQAVIVRHGKYFTTYSNLSSVSVSKGQEVKAGTVLGRAGVNSSGEGQFLFMVTNESGSPLNPESWLSRK